ncbi:MAG: uracil-DNA glycosylase [Mariniblastus sp.]
MSKARWNRLSREVKNCELCPRLITHCQTVAIEKRKAYRDEKYWGKPVPDFGGPNVSLLVVGLAPGAHGANRTGRMFTGDRSGEWLYRAMHKFGFANQAESSSRSDGLELIDAAITNICRCAPPDNKPNREELNHCQPYFSRTLELCDPIVVLALGSLAWRGTIDLLVQHDWLDAPKPIPKFAHGGSVKLKNHRWLIGSYHPSQQNTFTGRLTKPMFDSVFRKSKKLIQTARS